MKKKRTVRRLVWGVVIVALVVAIGVALRPRPLPVDIATVGSGAMRVTIDEEGETRVRNRFVVSAPVSGRVLRIDLEPGDLVTADDTVVATLQPSLPPLLDARTQAEREARIATAGSGLQQAEAARRRVEVDLEFARSELARQQELDEIGLVARDRLEAAMTNVRSLESALAAAESAVQSAEHDLELARAALLDATTPRNTRQAPIVVRAPETGVVLRRLRESEAVVPAGEPLIEIGDPANIEIVSDLLSTDAVRIRPGSPVLIEGWGGDRTLMGTVRRIEPSGFTKVSALGVEEQRVNVLIDFDDPPEASSTLGDGYRVEVRVVVWESDRTIKVPTNSLFRVNASGAAPAASEGASDWAVYVVEGGLAVERAVDVGQRNGLEAQILGGLAEGEEIILYPSDSVTDGATVVARAS